MDDEPHVLDALVSLLESQDDLELDIYCACSGKQALEVMDKGKIDLLVTDIQMPDITGIELADTVDCIWPFCKIIFLTAHSNFNYAYQAFQKNVVSYILKTEEDDFIIREIRKTIRSIEEELDKKHTLMEIEHSRNMHIDPVRRNLFFHLLTENGTSIKNLENFLLMLGYKEPLDNLFLVFGVIGNSIESKYTYTTDTCKPAYPNHYFIVTNLINHYMHDRLLHSVAEINDMGIMVFLLQIASSKKSNSKHNSQWLADILETVQSSYAATNGTEISFLIYPVVGNFHYLVQSYEECRTCISQLCPGEGKLIITRKPVTEKTEYDSNYLDNLVKTIKNYIDTNIFGDVSLMKLSSVTGYNATYLSGIFHNHTGEMLYKYIKRKKLEQIDQLFLNTCLDINTIARRAGFCSISYFNRFIKKATGLTPKIYRMKLLSQNES